MRASPPSELIPWNAYPWSVHERGKTTKLTAVHLNAGVEPLRRVIELMEPRLRVVMLHGGAAHKVWDRLAKRHPRIARRYSPVRTYHTRTTSGPGGPRVPPPTPPGGLRAGRGRAATGHRDMTVIGYARVSTADQNTEGQHGALTDTMAEIAELVGCSRATLFRMLDDAVTTS